MNSFGAIDMYIESSPLKRGEKLSKKELRDQMAKDACKSYYQFKTQKSERGRAYKGNTYRTKSSALTRIVPYERAKERKPIRDTTRRADFPDEKDEQLENCHYANFLGDKYTETTKYNTDCTVNLAFCDSRIEPEEDSSDRNSEYNCEPLYAEEKNYSRESKYYDYDALVHDMETQYMTLMDAAIRRYNERKEYEEELKKFKEMYALGCKY